jgi:non-homologous end joining protein Ku
LNLIDSAVWSLIKDLPSLSKQINEINPDEYIAQMDNQLINLINRKKENDIDENVAILNSVGKLTSPNIIQLIQKLVKQLKNLKMN